MDRRLAHVTSSELRPHLVLVCVGIYAFGILLSEPLWRRTITGLPAPVWAPAAPTHTPPTHTRSRHPRWSSSGIPRTSSPSFPQRGVPSRGLVPKDTPPFHCAPGSLHATARKNNRVYESYSEFIFKRPQTNHVFHCDVSSPRHDYSWKRKAHVHRYSSCDGFMKVVGLILCLPPSAAASLISADQSFCVPQTSHCLLLHPGPRCWKEPTFDMQIHNNGAHPSENSRVKSWNPGAELSLSQQKRHVRDSEELDGGDNWGL